MLTNEEIIHHFQRIHHPTANNLEVMLENVEKEKCVEKYLILPKHSGKI